MISLDSINKIYHIGDEPLYVLNGINLKIEEGEFISFMGPSGSGKTTMMNILGCLDKPSSGEYRFEEKLVSNLTENELARIRNSSIGFVFQQFNLLPKLSALQNVILPLTYAGVKKSERIRLGKLALEKLGLEERMNHFPKELSGGQKQRVAIARAIINNPKLILADEPTGALDRKTGKQIMEIFKKLNEEGTTVVLITHDNDVANYAERKIRIMDGRIDESSPSKFSGNKE
ncbi:ABC transporter ATP-binding protein [Exiguobacterium acetylicum]|uniref:ABC transporter ATP-binding protein n=1 Tax=Exiguobacterium acetylicum TaxID=41170 RepID=UPI0027DFC0EA|nr:ABC transporter ATP-binding protein [Exiguobacterium acetylicum]MDQ6468835.1 ABC transporter ATP-binding protein [Exiguobacterium acetylicum]